MQWPLRDLFIAYVERMKESARDQYRAEVLVWAVLAPYAKEQKRPPRVPSILK